MKLLQKIMKKYNPKKFIVNLSSLLILFIIIFFACSNLGRENPNDPENEHYTAYYTVTGRIFGLDGMVILQLNGTDNLEIKNIGGTGLYFSFPDEISDGSDYIITVFQNPESQICSVTNGNGKINGKDITDIVVNCSENTFTIGGTVTGLIGSGLVLQNSGGDDLVITENGSFFL